MIRPGGLAITALTGVLSIGAVTSAQAGAWAQKQGQGQVILKYEAMKADDGFDPSGNVVPLAATRTDLSQSALVEYGLTDRLTFQGKAEWQEGEDAYLDYEGRGPLEVGLRWQVHQTSHQVVSVYAGYAHGGSGRNAGYAAPGEGEGDWEVRLLAGHSRGPYFVDAQVARRWRQDLPDEVRADLTLGANVSSRWTLLGQVYAGRTDLDQDGEGAVWVTMEAGVVRHMGDWSGQIGWRQAAMGQETALSRGLVVAIWRRF